MAEQPNEADSVGGLDWTKARNRDLYLGFAPGANDEWARVSKAPGADAWKLELHKHAPVEIAFGSANSARLYAEGFAAGYVVAREEFENDPEDAAPDMDKPAAK